MSIYTKLWLLLVSFTIFAFLTGYLKLVSSTAIIILLITTFMKGQIIIDYFMDLKNVEGKYRYIPSAWLGIIIFLIGLAYYL